MKRVFIIAGESSGDLHGSALMKRMKYHQPEVTFIGIGGPLMVDEGLDAIRSVRDMNFMGLVEVLRHLPFIRNTIHDCDHLLENWIPDLVILIDYPGFNLKIAALAKKRGIPVMYYISPQLWAWHTSRVSLIRNYVDRMVVLFDFERSFYRRYGVKADFVGHPLIDVVESGTDRDSFRRSLGASDTIPLVGFLPGSRVQEIERILPSMTASVPLLEKRIGPYIPVLAQAPETDGALYDSYIADTDIKRLEGRTYDIIAHADAVAVTSGTATLEVGILSTPMVIVYRTSFLTYLMGRSIVDIDNIGLINIVYGSRIVPELWQYDVTPENIAVLLARFIREPELTNNVRKMLARGKEKLGKPGASDRAALIACEMME